jgi:8-oxo-dGTP diphosphatase
MQVRSSAQALIIRDEGVFTVVKTYQGKNEYILPGGGQEFGETLADAVKRECFEELGAEVRVDGLVTVREFIARNHSGNPDEQNIHVVNHIFACTLLTEPSLTEQKDTDQIGICWIPLTELEQYNFYPRFLISLLKSEQPLPFYLDDVN